MLGHISRREGQWRRGGERNGKWRGQRKEGQGLSNTAENRQGRDGGGGGFLVEVFLCIV